LLEQIVIVPLVPMQVVSLYIYIYKKVLKCCTV
jgi:hypothetical protein